MTGSKLLVHLTGVLDAFDLRQGALHHDLSGMHLLRYEETSKLEAALYRPLLCLVLQGAKEVVTSDRTLDIHAGQALVVSHALPVTSRVTSASPEHPYIALVFPLDLDLLRSLAPAVHPNFTGTAQSVPFSMCLCDCDEGMEDALHRYFVQSEVESTRRLLAPITCREIHARLLADRHAEGLQKLLWNESKASRIYQATRDIHANLSVKLAVGSLAQSAGMSGSAFFEHFRAVTGTSPIQYQKELRLLGARDKLKTTGEKVSEIAFSVGYDSPAQFSREYSRKFGVSPRQDRARN